MLLLVVHADIVSVDKIQHDFNKLLQPRAVQKTFGHGYNLMAALAEKTHSRLAVHHPERQLNLVAVIKAVFGRNARIDKKIFARIFFQSIGDQAALKLKLFMISHMQQVAPSAFGIAVAFGINAMRGSVEYFNNMSVGKILFDEINLNLYPFID